jgi:hypothetical protein
MIEYHTIGKESSLMNAYEFQAIPTNGYIKIPDEYAKRIDSKVIADDSSAPPQKTSAHSSLNDLIGIFKNCGDIDLQQERTERLKKYESLD